MGEKLSASDLQLYNFIDETLYYKWDPIGISDEPCARREYQGYLPVVFSMIKQGNTLNEIAEYLSSIEKDQMGLVPDKKRNLEIASMLLNKARSD